MFSPLLHSLSNSICNLRLQATWNRNVSDTQHSETAVFPSTSGWYNSMSKTPVSLGDDEPFGTSPGSSNCSSKQRFQRSTSVKKRDTCSAKVPWPVDCVPPWPGRSWADFSSTCTHNITLLFPSLFWQFCHCCTTPMTVRIQRVCIRLNNRFYLTLPRTAPTGKRQGHEYLWLLHHQQWWKRQWK